MAKTQPGSRLSTTPRPSPADDATPPRLAATAALAGAALVLTVLLVFAGGAADDPVASVVSTAHPVVWSRGEAPFENVLVDSLIAVGDRFVFVRGPVETGAELVYSTDGRFWETQKLDYYPAGVAVDGDGLVAIRDYGSVRLEWNGGGWSEGEVTALPTFARAGYLSGRPAIVPTDRGVLLHSVEGELYFSETGEAFDLVVGRGEWWDPVDDIWERFTAPAAPSNCSPLTAGSLDYPPIVVTPDGFVAFVPGFKGGIHVTWPVCEPELWVSRDGRRWSPATDAAGFEAGSFVYDVAVGSDRYVAVGGRAAARPAVWVSEDAISWSLVEWPEGGHVITAVRAGGLGFVVLGHSVDGMERLAWFSPDGRCWSPIPSHVQAVAAAVGPDRVVLAGRSRSPELSVAVWVGETAADDGGTCP